MIIRRFSSQPGDNQRQSALIVIMKRPGTARRPLNPVARAVRTPLYRPRAEEDKRRKRRDQPARPRGPVEPDES
jgi:hypothetical protein